VARQLATRLVLGIATLLAVSALVFLGMEALPGDAATAALGRDATPQSVTALRQQFDLDRPVLVRYGDWLGGLVHGDLGRSLPSGDTVWSLLQDRLRNTVMLALATILFLVPLSLLIGIGAALWRDSFVDHAVASSTLALMAVPEFVVGTLLAVLFSVWIQLLPPVSLVQSSESIFGQLSLLALPVATLLAASLAQTVRMIRASMLDVLDSEYVQMARLKGVPERTVLLEHALPNALGPTITILAFNIAWLTGGIVVVESVFQFPGVGSALVQAVSSRDTPTVQAIAMLITVAYVVVNMLADATLVVLNPRLRAAT
jgi:peptide/nickel transport system permease protein